MNLSLPSESVEYVRAVVTANADPTTSTVDFTFLAPGTAPASGWTAGEWEGSSEQLGGRWVATARVLVGAGALDLAEGTYTAFVRINAAPEAPIRDFGVITIT